MLAMAARPPNHHDTPYTVELVADRAGPVRCSSGPLLHAQRSFTEVVDADIVLVSSGIGYCKVLENSALLVWLGNQPLALRESDQSPPRPVEQPPIPAAGSVATYTLTPSKVVSTFSNGTTKTGTGNNVAVTVQ